MIRSFIRLLRLAWIGTVFTPIVILISRFLGLHAAPPSTVTSLWLTCLGVFAALTCAVFHRMLRKIEPALELTASRQAEFLDHIASRYIDLAIAGAAALSLFLELSVIRWQGTVFEFFAFYKNFGLLACFLGLGLGYALSGRRSIPLGLSIPMMAWQFVFMITLRFGDSGGMLASIRAIPLREQINLGASNSTNTAQAFAVYFLLTVVFLITALIFVPVGQVCGRLMQRRPNLRAYGLNLLGSLAGVVLMLLVSALWTPPPLWFALCCMGILLLTLRMPGSLVTGAVFTVVCVVALDWPVTPLSQRVYSPYQLLEIGHDEDTGLVLIRAAGQYYQRVYDLSLARTEPKLQPIRHYYDLPYKTHAKQTDVAIVGAGTGNDVAAALRSGAGHVDAIEIDPAILLAGQTRHPEKPYADPRVNAISNDARSFLRTTNRRYDMIVYGLLDSHTLLSQASSVRLDSFVYTVEGLRDARARLKSDGMISLSFCVMRPDMGRKIYLMLQQVFDGRPPRCVAAYYDGSVIFLESNDKSWGLPEATVSQAGFRDISTYYSDPSLRADVSTDDWPFFYMPLRVYPGSYLLMIGQILVLSLLITGNFVRERPQFSHLPFFFLGVGFMLVETKAITEMGLTFGNTWQVIGLVIASILVMAFLANCAVLVLKIRQPYIPYLILCATVLLGWSVARAGGLPSTTIGRIETTILLTSPLFFSGIVFSNLIANREGVAGIMALNLLGAVCGGLLEYNSMYFGFRSLYLLAIGCYFLAFITGLRTPQPRSEEAAKPLAACTSAM
jgi:spermidine synthase